MEHLKFVKWVDLMLHVLMKIKSFFKYKSLEITNQSENLTFKFKTCNTQLRINNISFYAYKNQILKRSQCFKNLYIYHDLNKMPVYIFVSFTKII